MAREPVDPHDAMTGLNKFNLHNKWDEELKKQSSEKAEEVLNKINKTQIEWFITHYIERSNFNNNKIPFEDIETRITRIIAGAEMILKGFPQIHRHKSSDQVHCFLEQELNDILTVDNRFDDSISIIISQITKLEKAASETLKMLQVTHPKRPGGRPTNVNADWFVYKLGVYYEQCGGKFFMPEFPGNSHPFLCYLNAINEHLPDGLKLTEDDLINRSRKMYKLRKNTPGKTRTNQ